MNIEISNFMADLDRPLIVSFTNFLADHDVSTRIEYGYWDLLGFTDDDSPAIAAMVRRTMLSSREIFRLTEKISPVKVVLLEGEDLPLDDIEALKVFCASIGVYLYVSGVGWVVSRNKPIVPYSEDWSFQMLSRYRKDDNGVWSKECRSCGKLTPHWDFYKRGKNDRNARDPYRNICKTCSKAAWSKSTRERKARVRAGQQPVI